MKNFIEKVGFDCSHPFKIGGFNAKRIVSNPVTKSNRWSSLSSLNCKMAPLGKNYYWTNRWLAVPYLVLSYYMLTMPNFDGGSKQHHWRSELWRFVRFHTSGGTPSPHQCGCGESLAATRGKAENCGIFVMGIVGLSQYVSRLLSRLITRYYVGWSSK